MCRTFGKMLISRKVVKLFTMLLKRALKHNSIAMRVKTYDRSASRLNEMLSWY